MIFKYAKGGCKYYRHKILPSSHIGQIAVVLNCRSRSFGIQNHGILDLDWFTFRSVSTSGNYLLQPPQNKADSKLDLQKSS